MGYYFSKTLHLDFDDAIEQVTQALKEKGFGIITEIDLRETFKKKLDKDFRPYKVLGACNPNFAFEALQREDKIGTMLPCNVIIQEKEDGEVEVAAINPVASMTAVENKELKEVAGEVESRLKEVIDSL
jgi:uncharacterized protein (DUF302 family)